jgi:hypothetical protein
MVLQHILFSLTLAYYTSNGKLTPGGSGMATIQAFLGNNSTAAESQHIVNVNWDKLQTISNGVLSTIATTATNTTSTSAGGVGLSIPSILGNNTGAAAAILPITNTMANLGIPLTGSTAMGFTIGFFKG